MNYLYHLLSMTSLYLVLGLSLNLVLGFGGRLSLCHAAFYGIGAYAYALATVSAHYSFVIAVAAAIAAAAGAAALVGVAVLRFRGDFFVFATMAFQTIVFVLLYNAIELTRGPYGISGIPRPALGTFAFDDPGRMFLLAGLVATICWGLLRYVTLLPFGRTLEAVRDDALAAESLGKNPLWFHWVAFTLAGGLAGAAGALFACYAGYIDPTSFTADESVFILCIVVIGGAGNLPGPIVGAVVLVLLPEGLRFVGLPDAAAANVRQMIYGSLLVVLMRFRPQGIAGRYAFD